MKPILVFSLFIIVILSSSCHRKEESENMNIIFLHHSTGEVIWTGDANPLINKAFSKLIKSFPSGELPALFKNYNRMYKKNYQIKEFLFPKRTPYGWNNFPFDYYNIWVKNAGNEPYLEEPTLEMLAKEYQVIIFKHCFPVSNIQEDTDSISVNSDKKTIPNYKLQYEALRDKLHEFPEIKFILFTGAAQVKSRITDDEAERAQVFINWVKNNWDLPDDNIFLWDLYSLQTEGGLYFKDEYSVSQTNSHPNKVFGSMAAKLLFYRIIDVIEYEGEKSSLTGEKLSY